MKVTFMGLKCFSIVLYYETIESDCDKPWVLFLHGAGGSTATWNYQREVFATEFNLLLIDLRDHGKSKLNPPSGPYTFDLISSEILEVVDHLKIQKAWIVSLSFGSVLLQHLAMQRPDLVLGATMAGAIFDADLLIRSFVSTARALNLFLPYSKMYSLFSWLLMPRVHHQLSRRLYQRQARLLSPEEYLRWVGLYGEFFRMLRKFWNQRLDFPVQVVMGAEDYIFLPRARKFVNSRQNVDLLILEGAGHICNIDKPGQFNESGILFIKNRMMVSNVSGNPRTKPAPENLQHG